MVSKQLFSLENLSQYVGDDPNQIKEMIKIFLDTTPPEIDLMKDFAEKQEWFEVYKLAHRMKPSIEVFAMYDLLEDVRKIEHIAHENNSDNTLLEYLDRVSTKFSEVWRLLEKEL